MTQIRRIEHLHRLGQGQPPAGVDRGVDHLRHRGRVDLGGQRREAGQVELALSGLGGLRVGQVADPEAQCANRTDGVAGQGEFDVEARVGQRALEQRAGGADRVAQLTGHPAALLQGPERGEPLDPLGAALLDAFHLVDLLADELEEARHHLAQRRVKGGQRVGDGGDVGLELGPLVGIVDHPHECAVAVAALGIPRGLVIGVHLTLPVAVFQVAVDRLVQGGGGPLDHGAVLADVGDQPFHLQGDGVGFVVHVGHVDVTGAVGEVLAAFQRVEFGLQRGDLGLDAGADPDRVVAHAQSDLLEAGGDAVDRPAGGDGVLAAQSAQEIQGATGVLREIAEVALDAGALVGHPVQPALAGPALDQAQAGLFAAGPAEFVEVAFEAHHEVGFTDHAVAEVTFHQGGVAAQVERGQQADRGGALDVAIDFEEVSGRQGGVVVHAVSPSM